MCLTVMFCMYNLVVYRAAIKGHLKPYVSLLHKTAYPGTDLGYSESEAKPRNTSLKGFWVYAPQKLQILFLNYQKIIPNVIFW